MLLIQIGSKNSASLWAVDINNDNVINMSDIVKIDKVFSSCPDDVDFNKDYDFNKDNIINITDIMIMQNILIGRVMWWNLPYDAI